MKLQPISKAPKDGTYILLAGPSGYSTTPFRFEACRYDDKYRPLQPWVNHANDSFEDGGEPATHWCHLPEVAEPEIIYELGSVKEFTLCSNNRACGWYGLEEELVYVPERRPGQSVTVATCPKCGNLSRRTFYLVPPMIVVDDKQNKRLFPSKYRKIPDGWKKLK